MPRVKEFTVTIEDKPGALGKCFHALAERGVNILAFQSYVDEGESLARMVVDDPATAKKFLDQAAISYGKAIDAKPSEKNFLEPQNRIETALAHYRKLERQPVEAHAHSSSDTPEGGAISTAAQTPQRDSQSRSVSVKPQKPPVTNASLKEDAGPSAGSSLTNDQVIKLFKAGMDEQNLIATVTESRSTNFDVSVDGELQLVNAGIKGKLLTAIRHKAATQKTHP